MGDETPPNPMNLDLNLGPVDNESLADSMNLEEWLNGPVRRIREAITQRSPYRRMPSQWWDRTTEIAIDIVNESGLEMGEASVAVEERPTDEPKACDNNNGFLGIEAFGKKENLENGNGVEGSIFDCNICLDLAKEPVLTSCGHLFCWPCLYRWLNIHSDSKECPICKGEVTVKNLTPIYGSGSNNHAVKVDSSLKIPPRPQARRVESWRQTIERNGVGSIPVEQMIELLGGRFEPTGDLVQVQDGDNNLLVAVDPSGDFFWVQDRNSTRESQGIQRAHNNTPQPIDPVDSSSQPVNTEAGDNRNRSPLLHRRARPHRAATLSNLTSALSSVDSIVDSYIRRSHREQPVSVDDRDSVSSITAVIQSESQTVDTTVEIDSRVSRSTSSSRRRNDSRVSDVDSGDSRAPRRRRFYY